MKISGQILMGVGIHAFEMNRNEFSMLTPSRLVFIEPWFPIQVAHSLDSEIPECKHIFIVFSNNTIQFREDVGKPKVNTVQCDFLISLAR
ncbi:hypothetical protein B9Z55_023725 [Caenorhabditis nigoni]|uniref:Uncharacterized protein n=2 Tax=Caenorhabditis nigoni TaxID=1611254 RepID=A0A2G5SRN4_9PELO|nr:hypothetical protein B9Z55_023725 [Caenorhabditis nigoni]